MGSDDQREFRKFFGVSVDDWEHTYGTFSNTHYILLNDYISEGCSTTDSSEASVAHSFLYPQHIKKTAYIEGVIEGEICLTASSASSTVTSYRVTVCKTFEGAAEADIELATTGWVTVSDTINWDAGLSVGDEMVYHYWIDVWNEQIVTENERLYLKVEVDCNQYTHLMHSNDSTWEDIWIDIPFRL